MLPSGTQVDAYVLERRVALGATSEVYAARHPVRHEAVAVKVLSTRWCGHPEVVARFLNEAQSLLELRHPHLVRAMASGVLPNGQQPFLVLEWLPLDLHQWLPLVGGRLSAEDSARIVGQLASVLAMLHARGLIHRDLKPANILMVRDGASAPEVKLADLGLAKHGETARPMARHVSTAGSAVLGTWDYMAPEQWTHSKQVGVEVDIYALGILWFQLLVGRLPFQGDDEQSLMVRHVMQLPPLVLLEGLAPDAQRTFLGRMLDKVASKRPSLMELQALLASSGAFPREAG
ncbi:serine/threonine-protein kinase [Corallococcus carmarthensis]|uniref:Serine/threonine protein kinase n=1 Tax=Corallococcus carmarthensis TaxID=2316728 RepID=A0A3A8K3K1_9BACT|nr:serine/threonine-protein kinase [Corallococcus carmarthensis]RKH02096.1 serine/threonine protein kinase [Corallococcus carmarthensis]